MRMDSLPDDSGTSAAHAGPACRQAAAGFLLAVAILLLFFACGSGSGSGASMQASAVTPQVALVSRFSGLSAPLGVTHAGDNTGKLYVVEQAGRIRLIDNGTLLAAPFLDISARVISGGEQGLLGLAFPPGYAPKRYLYVS